LQVHNENADESICYDGHLIVVFRDTINCSRLNLQFCDYNCKCHLQNERDDAVLQNSISFRLSHPHWLSRISWVSKYDLSLHWIIDENISVKRSPLYLLVIIVIDLAGDYKTIEVLYEPHLSARRPICHLYSFREHFMSLIHAITFPALFDLLLNA
jgi:hypothetical protein